MRKTVLAALMAAVLGGGCGGRSPAEPEASVPPVYLTPVEAHFPGLTSALFTATGGDGASYRFEVIGNETTGIFRVERATANQVLVTRIKPDAGGQMALRVTSPEAAVPSGVALEPRHALAVLYVD